MHDGAHRNAIWMPLADTGKQLMLASWHTAAQQLRFLRDGNCHDCCNLRLSPAMMQKGAATHHSKHSTDHCVIMEWHFIEKGLAHVALFDSTAQPCSLQPQSRKSKSRHHQTCLTHSAAQRRTHISPNKRKHTRLCYTKLQPSISHNIKLTGLR